MSNVTQIHSQKDLQGVEHFQLERISSWREQTLCSVTTPGSKPEVPPLVTILEFVAGTAFEAPEALAAAAVPEAPGIVGRC